jgi:inhibitor of cysteine peptidase
MAATVPANRALNYLVSMGPALIPRMAALFLVLSVLAPLRSELSGKGKARMLHADESYNGQTVSLAVGDSIDLALAENPTTGYRWRLVQGATKADNAACPCVKDDFEPGRTGVAGQGGTHRWEFKAAEPGDCAIKLEYRRSWEKDTEPERTFRIQLEVRNVKGAQSVHR